MRRRVILKALLGSGAVSALGGLGVLGTRAAAQGAAGSPAAEPYSLSYAAGGYDSRGNFLGGTELMNLTAFGGRLYAGVGYWMDRPAVFAAGYEQRGPAGPGNAQVLVLDSRGSQWRQEYAFGQAHRLSAMEIVRFPRANVAMLAVGLDSGNGGVFTQRAPGVWENTGVPTQTPIRSLAVHYDTADGREKLFAATGGAEDRYFDRAVYAGSYDPGAPGRIRWDPTPERVSAEARTMSMTECDGVLYAAAKPSIYRRNDARRGWEVLYTNPISDSFGHTHFTSGFRGLTCIAGPDGRHALLSGFEGTEGNIYRIDVQTGAATTELYTRRFLAQQWGGEPTRPNVIAGYNDIPEVAAGVRVFGLAAQSPTDPTAAWFLSRTDGNPPRYALHKVSAPARWPYSRSDTQLWSVRQIALSPFPEDQNQVLYMGGYDGHFAPDHNTAWLYRVGLQTALAH